MKSKNYNISFGSKKHVFCAINNSFENFDLITADIFFNDIKYGDSEEEIYLKYLLNGFKKIQNAQKLDVNDQNFGEVFCHLKTNLGAENKRLNTFKYLLSFGNLDDKLFSFVYRHNNKINIIWKKFGKGNFKILKGTIDIDVFDVFYDDFLSYYKNKYDFFSDKDKMHDG